MRSTCFALVVLALASRASATMFTVDRGDDQVDVTPGNGVCAVAGGGCTLRGAIQEGNALAGIDTIVLPSGTYDLTRTGSGEDAAATGDLDVTRSTTIIGDGADATIIDASALQDRVFDLHGEGALIDISGVTIRGGNATGNGGGINSTADLTLTECVIAANRTTGNGSAGGGIYASGELSMTACVVDGNAATGSNGDGGGIAFAGASSVGALSRSAIIRNAAGRHGGGMQLNVEFLSLDSCTVSGNTANGDGGGVRVSGGMADLRHVTVARNTADFEADGNGGGGGLRRAGGSVRLFASLLAENSDNSGSAPNCSGTFTVTNDNLVENRLGCTFEPAPPINAGPALLGLLQNNGGATLTHALRPGSKAIDAAAQCVFLLQDQRGLPRPADGDGDAIARCDLGAYEVQPGTPTATPQPTDTASPTCSCSATPTPTPIPTVLIEVDATTDAPDAQIDGICRTAVNECTLRAAIQETNAADAQTLIRLQPGALYTLTLEGRDEDDAAQGDLDIARNVTIDGDGAVVDGNATDRVFHVLPLGSARLTLRALTVRNGDAVEGGGILNRNRLQASDVTISGNHATTNGGGLFNRGLALLSNLQVTGNSAGDSGGGVYSEGGMLDLQRAALTGNRAAVNGGALLFRGGGSPLGALLHVTISGNRAQRGGGMYNDASVHFSLSNLTVADNTAEIEGHAIFDTSTAMEVRDSIVTSASPSGNCAGATPFTNASGNIDNGTSCFPGTINQNGVDPLLGPLQDNGGATLTHALLPGSPAIDATVSCFTAVDQRGVPRPADGDGDGDPACDAGAYELQAAAVATPTFTTGLATASPSATGATTATPLPTGTVTATGTSVATTTGAVTPTIAPEATPTASPTGTPRCAGDCSGDARTSIDEIVLMVSIALERTTLDACLVADANGNGSVTIDEIVAAVNAALMGCAT